MAKAIVILKPRGVHGTNYMASNGYGEKEVFLSKKGAIIPYNDENVATFRSLAEADYEIYKYYNKHIPLRALVKQFPKPPKFTPPKFKTGAKVMLIDDEALKVLNYKLFRDWYDKGKQYEHLKGKTMVVQEFIRQDEYNYTVTIDGKAISCGFSEKELVTIKRLKL